MHSEHSVTLDTATGLPIQSTDTLSYSPHAAGYPFDTLSISLWLRHHPICPLTLKPLKLSDLNTGASWYRQRCALIAEHYCHRKSNQRISERARSELLRLILLLGLVMYLQHALWLPIFYSFALITTLSFLSLHRLLGSLAPELMEIEDREDNVRGWIHPNVTAWSLHLQNTRDLQALPNLLIFDPHVRVRLESMRRMLADVCLCSMIPNPLTNLPATIYWRHGKEFWTGCWREFKALSLIGMPKITPQRALDSLKSERLPRRDGLHLQISTQSTAVRPPPMYARDHSPQGNALLPH